MKLIEALKKQKDLVKKTEDIRRKIAIYHADMDHESPTYGTTDQQRQQISEWLQAHGDIIKEMLSLRFRIQKTNIVTPVSIELGGKLVTKTIAEWIHRRKDLALADKAAWDALTDKKLPPVAHIQSTTNEQKEIKIRRYYDPRERDAKQELYRSEPHVIDGTLEVINAVTELVD